jgi:tungstate transport system ATP-binding protein
MAVVFQEPLLLDAAVAENVATGLRLRGVPRSVQERRVAAWLDRFGIAALARRSARTLSGGEAQRASLARAFALEPEVLFLDEPFSALDSPTRAALTADLLVALHATRTTTVLVTHDRDEALAVGSRVAVLIDGRLRQVGPPEEVFSAPIDPEVAAFVGVENVVPGRVVGHDDGVAQVSVGACSLAAVSGLRPGTPVLVCLRPEDVTLYPEPTAPAGSARNRLSGRVTSIIPWGGQARVALDCGFPLAAFVTRRSAAELELAPGARVVATIKATSIHLIERPDDGDAAHSSGA